MMRSTLKSLAFAAMFALATLGTPVQAQDLAVSGNLRLSCGTATASGGAATLANKCGVVTSEALTTAVGSTYTLTLTNTVAAAADLALCSVANGTNTGGAISVYRCQPAASSLTVTVKNDAAGASGSGSTLNGTIVIRYLLLK